MKTSYIQAAIDDEYFLEFCYFEEELSRAVFINQQRLLFTYTSPTLACDLMVTT